MAFSGALTRPYGARAEPSTLPEKMDGDTSFETFRGTLQSLARVNQLSFGARPQMMFLRRTLRGWEKSRELSIVDVGSGYGDSVRAMARVLAQFGVKARITGVDLNPHAATAAREATTAEYPGVQIDWITADVFDYIKSSKRPDLIVSALFCHHLETEDLPAFLSWMDRYALRGWLINDLYRSRFAAAGFSALTTLLNFHPFVRHDGPVSFARAFRRDDWTALLREAGVSGARTAMLAPFRLCVEKHVEV